MPTRIREMITVTSKVAIVKFNENAEAQALQEAIRLIGSIDDLNSTERNAVVKVGVFSHKAEHHTYARARIKNI